MTAPNPLAAPIDRATRGFAFVGISPKRQAEMKAAILAEIEAEWGPITVERASTGYYKPWQTRLVTKWRAEQ